VGRGGSAKLLKDRGIEREMKRKTDTAGECKDIIRPGHSDLKNFKGRAMNHGL